MTDPNQADKTLLDETMTANRAAGLKPEPAVPGWEFYLPGIIVILITILAGLWKEISND